MKASVRIFDTAVKAAGLLLLLFYLYCILGGGFNLRYDISMAKYAAVYAAVMLTVYFLARMVKRRSVAALLVFGISFGVIIAWDCLFRSTPVSDYAVLLDGARRITDGTFKSTASDVASYFYFYNFQIGYVFYLAILIKIFGFSLKALKIAEAVLISLTNVFFFLTLQTYCRVESSFYGSILLALFLPIVMGSSIINNQHPAMFFLAASLYILSRSQKRIRWIMLSGILLGIAQVMRPSSQVVLLSIVLYAVCLLLFRVAPVNRRNLVTFAILIVSYAVSFYGIGSALRLAGYAPNGITGSNDPYFKIVLGLGNDAGVYEHPTTDAEHTQLYYDLKTVGFDYRKYNQQCLALISRQLRSEPKQILRSTIEKMKRFAGEYDNQFDFIGAPGQNHTPLKLWISGKFPVFGQMMYFFSVLFALLSLSDKRRWNRDRFYLIVFILYFLAHTLLEVQPRYRYEQYFFLLLISCPFEFEMIDRLIFRRDRTKKEKKDEHAGFRSMIARYKAGNESAARRFTV